MQRVMQPVVGQEIQFGRERGKIVDVEWVDVDEYTQEPGWVVVLRRFGQETEVFLPEWWG